MYLFEFLIYHVNPYGINHNSIGKPSKNSYYMNFNTLVQSLANEEKKEEFVSEQQEKLFKTSNVESNRIR